MTVTTDLPAGTQLATAPRQRRRHRAAPPPRSYGKPIAALALAGVAVATGSTSAVAADRGPQEPTTSTGQMPALSPALAARAAAAARAEAQRAAEQAQQEAAQQQAAQQQAAAQQAAAAAAQTAHEALAAQQQAQTTASTAAQGGSWAAWSSTTTRPNQAVPAASPTSSQAATQGERVTDALATTGSTTPLLVLGSSGRRVAAWQQSLSAWRTQHGQTSVDTDGTFGTETLNATVAFQRSTGIVVDGIVGPITNGAMSSAGSSSDAPDTSATPTTAAVASTSATVTNADDSSSDPSTSSAASSSVSAQDVAAAAERYLGVPYLYGGTTSAGFDCSGFTQHVFGQLGVDLPRTAAAQAGVGAGVSSSSARLGDLVLFWSGGHVYHVGIYLGDGQMVAAPKPGDRVKVESVYSSDVTYRRVI